MAHERTSIRLGAAELILRPSEDSKSCGVFLKTDKAVQLVMTLAAEQYNTRDASLENYTAKIYQSYAEPECAFREVLLHPDYKPAVIMLPDGRLYCRKCHCYVSNTANAEMRKEGCFSHRHICGVIQPSETYLKPEEYPKLPPEPEP